MLLLYVLLLALLYLPMDCVFFAWGGLPMLAYSYVVGCFALLAGSVPLHTRRWPLTLFLMAAFSLPLPFLAEFGWPRGEFRSLAALVGVRAALFVLATALGWWVIRRAQRRARIAAERSGIAEMEATLAKLPLSIIERVEFYKRDELTTDLVCCDVTTNEKPPQVWLFHEEAPGWDRLLAHLEQLPGFAKDWRRQVIQPPFAESRFVAFARARVSPAGWAVAVDRPNGAVLYVVAAPIHVDAEQIVRRNLGLSEDDLAVQASHPLDQPAIDKWRLKPGEMKGPM